MPTECLRLLFSNYGILVSTFEAPRLTVTDWIEKNCVNGYTMYIGLLQDDLHDQVLQV